VVADSLGIPNRWIELNRGREVVTGSGFKFRDYYSNFDMEDESPLRLSPAATLDSICDDLRNYHRPHIFELKRRLRQMLVDLATHFGASMLNCASLEELHDRTHQRTEQRRLWNNRARLTVGLLEKMVPAGERFVLVDEEQMRFDVRHAPALPMIEEGGESWGPPDDDSHAITECQRHLKSGIRYIVFAWPAFWWLDTYPGLHRFLRKQCRCLLENENVVFFECLTSAGR
jgi:hypothetical protein